MAEIKNCLFCKYCTTQYYQENYISSPEVRFPHKDIFGNECGYACSTTHEVHPNQTEECKYFKMGFWAKVARFRSKLCSKMFLLVKKIR